MVLPLVLWALNTATVNASPLPIAMKFVVRPTTLIRGHKKTFTVELTNTSKNPVTISTLFAFTWGLDWSHPDGSGEGTYSGGGYKTIIGTNYDPKTGEFTCKYLHYGKNDFVTLMPKSSKRFDIVISVPERCRASIANLDISFESKYDGSEVDINASVGKLPPLKTRVHVSKN